MSWNSVEPRAHLKAQLEAAGLAERLGEKVCLDEDMLASYFWNITVVAGLDPRLVAGDLEESARNNDVYCDAIDEFNNVVARHAVELQRAEEKVFCAAV